MYQRRFFILLQRCCYWMHDASPDRKAHLCCLDLGHTRYVAQQLRTQLNPVMLLQLTSPLQLSLAW